MPFRLQELVTLSYCISTNVEMLVDFVAGTSGETSRQAEKSSWESMVPSFDRLVWIFFYHVSFSEY